MRLLLCTFGLATVGCDAGEPRMDVYPVSGSVVVDAAPAVDVQLVFHPCDEATAQSVFPRAKSDEQGKFVLSTYASADGIPAGEYVVTASWKLSESAETGESHPDELSLLEERLDARFTQPERTPLHVVVEARDNQLTPFDLKLASKQRRRKQRRRKQRN